MHIAGQNGLPTSYGSPHLPGHVSKKFTREGQNDKKSFFDEKSPSKKKIGLEKNFQRKNIFNSQTNKDSNYLQLLFQQASHCSNNVGN